MTISAKLIAASRTKDSTQPPLVTMELRYPRFIHAEFMTHRVFSRNASSSRAVPVAKMIQDVIDDPAMPVRWGANQPGMRDAGDHDAPVIVDRGRSTFERQFTAEEAWLEARYNAVRIAHAFAAAGYHKQVVNRLLEPFAHITVIVTATEWENFFDLRCHEAADPTMRALAEAVRDAMPESNDEVSCLHEQEWHLPYVTPEDQMKLHMDFGIPQGEGKVHKSLRLISAARCARVSYLNHDGSEPDPEKDLALAQRLLSDRHMSPFEHQAHPDVRNHNLGWDNAKMHGNLRGWVQSRKLLESHL